MSMSKKNSIPTKRLSKWNSEANMADFASSPDEMQKYVGNKILWRRTNGEALAKKMKIEEQAKSPKTLASYYGVEEDSDADDEDSTFNPDATEIADYSSDDELIIAHGKRSVAYGLSATDRNREVVRGSGYSLEERKAQRVHIRGFFMDVAKKWPGKKDNKGKKPTLGNVSEYCVSQLRFSMSELAEEHAAAEEEEDEETE